jgi:Asp-tRNA(Asn)/Glu-tRNA(Gln) amidotransferase A subunit family amidase
MLSGRGIGLGMRVIGLIMSSVSFPIYRMRVFDVLTSYLDDIDLVDGMPICVQIVGERFGEEKAMAVAKVVDRLMNVK